tara:strand:- start:978 stop:1112 length:135 start_codon:yes stop_codon:yes gene_type:complete
MAYVQDLLIKAGTWQREIFDTWNHWRNVTDVWDATDRTYESYGA